MTTAIDTDLNWAAFDQARGTHPRVAKAAAGQQLAPGSQNVKLTPEQAAQIKLIQKKAGLPQTGTLTAATVAYAKANYTKPNGGGGGSKSKKKAAKKKASSARSKSGSSSYNTRASKAAAAKKKALALQQKKLAAQQKKLAAQQAFQQRQLAATESQLRNGTGKSKLPGQKNMGKGELAAVGTGKTSSNTGTNPEKRRQQALLYAKNHPVKLKPGEKQAKMVTGKAAHGNKITEDDPRWRPWMKGKNVTTGNIKRLTAARSKRGAVARHPLKVNLSNGKVSAMTLDLAITPGGRVGDASPLGKPGSKRKLSDYEREVAHALMRKRGIPKERAIPMARGIIDKAAKTGRWGRGKKASPAVRAGAVASVAQRKSFSNDNVAVVYDLAGFSGKKAAPFVKGGKRKKSHPNDAHGNPKSAKAKQLAAKMRDTNLSNDVDLAPKWKHGFIPLNAEAVAIKNHKAKGHGPESGPKHELAATAHIGKVSKKSAAMEQARKTRVAQSGTIGGKSVLKTHGNHGGRSTEKRAQIASAKTTSRAKVTEPKAAKKSMANGQKYHSDSTKMKMTQADLREHANQHAAAAGRARSADSKLKHTQEAQKALNEIQRRKDAKKPSKPGANKPRVKPAAPKAPKAPKATTPKADDSKLKATSEMTHNELLKEIKKASKAQDAKKMRVLKKEVAKRQRAALQITAHAKAAKALIDKELGPEGLADVAKAKRVFAKVSKRFPSLRDNFARLASSEHFLNVIRSKEKFKAFVDEAVREATRRVAGPLIGSGIASLGITILQAKG